MIYKKENKASEDKADNTSFMFNIWHKIGEKPPPVHSGSCLRHDYLSHLGHVADNAIASTPRT